MLLSSLFRSCHVSEIEGRGQAAREHVELYAAVGMSVNGCVIDVQVGCSDVSVLRIDHGIVVRPGAGIRVVPCAYRQR